MILCSFRRFAVSKSQFLKSLLRGWSGILWFGCMNSRRFEAQNNPLLSGFHCFMTPSFCLSVCIKICKNAQSILASLTLFSCPLALRFQGWVYFFCFHPRLSMDLCFHWFLLWFEIIFSALQRYVHFVGLKQYFFMNFVYGKSFSQLIGWKHVLEK